MVCYAINFLLYFVLVLFVFVVHHLFYCHLLKCYLLFLYEPFSSPPSPFSHPLSINKQPIMNLCMYVWMSVYVYLLALWFYFLVLIFLKFFIRLNWNSISASNFQLTQNRISFFFFIQTVIYNRRYPHDKIKINWWGNKFRQILDFDSSLSLDVFFFTLLGSNDCFFSHRVAISTLNFWQRENIRKNNNILRKKS